MRHLSVVQHLSGNLEGKECLGKPTNTLRSGCVDCIHVAHDGVQRGALVNTAMSLPVSLKVGGEICN
jgi:hypothetical protein